MSEVPGRSPRTAAVVPLSDRVGDIPDIASWAMIRAVEKYKEPALTEPTEVKVVGPVTILTFGDRLLFYQDRVDVRTLPQKERAPMVSFAPSDGAIGHKILG